MFALALAILLTHSVSHAQSTAPINVQMKKISDDLERLLPGLIDEGKFTDKANEKSIQASLKNLITNFEQLKSHPAVQNPGYKISREQIVYQLKSTRDLFDHNKSMARHSLNSSLGLCVSCHTQLPNGAKLKLFGSYDLENKMTGPYEKGEFYFITRDFEKAVANYDYYINSFSKNIGDVSRLENALNRKLTYFTRMRPSGIIQKSDFESNLSNKELPNSVRERVMDWVNEFTKKENSTPINVAEMKPEQMKDFLEKITHANEESPGVNLFSYIEAKDLRNSGILYRYLNAHPESPLIPEILYNLALFDKRLNLNLFYSLGDLYLLECMDKYSTNPVAKKCYQAYEDDKIFSYTGSAGTSMPKAVKNELDKLKKKVGIKK